jgi:hypothetical protein
VAVSDEMSHSPSTVHAIIDKLIPELKLLSPELSFIHYWTDGPTSQYRNRQCFFTVANHRELYGVICTSLFSITPRSSITLGSSVTPGSLPGLTPAYLKKVMGRNSHLFTIGQMDQPANIAIANVSLQ